MSERVSERVSEWVSEWVSERVSERVSEWVSVVIKRNARAQSSCITPMFHMARIRTYLTPKDIEY